MTMEKTNPPGNAAVDFRELFRDLRATLKAGGQDTQQALQAVVELLAAHFRSDVCSLYQSDEARSTLFLRASKGLRPEAIGRTALAPGEGLVGTIAETRQALALEDAQADPRFQFRPETGEEIYHSFLGVPLIRAGKLIGVLVVQHCRPRRYSAEEIEDCETVAQFLSVMLQQVADRPGTEEAGRPPGALRLAAVTLSPGLALGKVVLHLKDILIRRWRAADPGPELVRVQAALQDLEAGLEALMATPEKLADPEVRELLEADLMLARDQGWRRKIEAAITRGLSAEAAVQSVREDLRSRMKAVTNDYIRARLLDLDDLSYRLLAALTGAQGRDLGKALGPDAILVCRSLGTAELLRIGRGGIGGLVVMDATPASHLAIIATSLRIPALGQVPGALTELREGDSAIVDAVNGQLIGRPSPSVVAAFEAHLAARKRRAMAAPLKAGGLCKSRDGVSLHLSANAGLLLDLDDIAPVEGLGIGLYRTEMAFLVRSDWPSVDDQARLYRQIYQRMGDRPVVFRSLDVGSDKALSYLQEHRAEANPALGWRAIRLGLDRPELLADQLRALMMAADGRALRIMFPMITEVEEFEAARGVLRRVAVDHRRAGGRLPEPLDVGVMIEVPALLWDLERLMEAADFVSLGSNDLFQFLNAADRTNPKTDRRFEPLRPANLRLMTSITAAAAAEDRPVSVCGELAATALGLIALVGCGYRSFSMSAARIADMWNVLQRLDVGLVEARIQALSRHPGGSVRREIAALAEELGVEIDPAEDWQRAPR